VHDFDLHSVFHFTRPTFGIETNLAIVSSGEPVPEKMDTIERRKYSLCVTLSARNRLEGKIVELQLGGVMAHVVVKVGENLIESVITRRSAEEMKLKVGDTVSAIIKSTEVMLEKS
jgi:molybdopterin-binding protein